MTLDEHLTGGNKSLPLATMTTDRQKQIEKTLMECLRQLAGDKFPDELKPEDDVLMCCGLDSQHGVELACDLATILEIEIPLKDNPLIVECDENGKKRARRCSEVIEYLSKLSD